MNEPEQLESASLRMLNLFGASPENTGLAHMFLFQSGGDLRRSQIREFEQQLIADSTDINIRLQICGFYANKRFRSPADKKQYLKHVLWFIDNKPDEYTLNTAVFLTTDEDLPKIKRHWRKAIRKNFDDVTVLLNASHSLRLASFKDAEFCLKRLLKLEAENEDWHRELAALYRLHARETQSLAEIKWAKLSILCIKTAIQLHEQHPRRSYLEQYFRMELLQYADLALRIKLNEDAQLLGQKLLGHGDANTRGDSTITSVDPKRHAFVHYGHAILGRVELSNGSSDSAKAHLQSMLQFAHSSFELDLTLAKGLWSAKESLAVIAYIDGCRSVLSNALNVLKQNPGEQQALRSRVAMLEKYLSDIQSGLKPRFATCV